MKILQITAKPLHIPLKKPFITALRTASSIENVLITIHTDEPGFTGYGEAAAIPAVTGETAAGINAAVLNHIAPQLIGRPVSDFQLLTNKIDGALHGNTSAKSGVETALYDVFAKSIGVPVYRLLGGNKDLIPENNITVSATDVPEMIQNCLDAVNENFRRIKIKLGKTPATDYEALIKINEAINIGPHTEEPLQQSHSAPLTETSPRQSPSALLQPKAYFRVDGNCGWTAKEAVRLIRRWEDAGVPLEWVEQPVPAWDIPGLKLVTQNTDTPIMADESCFNERDAIRLLETRAADWVNVKLAKAGGIGHALNIARICRTYGVPCMMGCMLESNLGTTMATHAAATGLFEAIDLDGPLLCANQTEPPSDYKEYVDNLAEFSGRSIKIK